MPGSASDGGKDMNEYEKPKMEVITLLGDVITASCPNQTDETCEMGEE